MEKNLYEKLYEWEEFNKLMEEFLPELIKRQENIADDNPVNDLPRETRLKLENIGFSKDGRDADEVVRQMMDDVYLHRMRTNHPRFFGFIPAHISPYSVFGDILNTFHNPYGGGFELSKGVAILENQTIKYMGGLVGYDEDKLGGQFTSGGSLANLTGMIVGRDEKLNPKDFYRGTVYTSDQTHSSVAKAAHLMGIPRENMRVVESDDEYRIRLDKLEEAIVKDMEDGYIPFMIVGSGGATNTGAIDPLNELADISEKYDLWFHVDGAYGASILMSSHKDLLDGIEKSDSVSWDGHKWLFQTYGCAMIICKDKMKLLKTYSVNPEYLKDVESTNEDYNFWDTGVEMTKPARGMRLWFTLQSLGTDVIKSAIDKGFDVVDWIEEEIKDDERFEIVSKPQIGIINFRYVNSKYTEKQLDEINRKISKMGLEENYATFLTTILKGKTVLRFCCNSPLTTRGEIKKIIQDINRYIEIIEREYN